MRRILISRRGEFSYKSSQLNLLGYAIKQLGKFFDEVDKEKETKVRVTVSNKTLNSDARKASAG